MLKNTYFLVLTFFVLGLGSIQSQDFNMQNGTINTCSGNFYDSGGPDTDYDSNENLVFTICPNDAVNERVVVDFIEFQTPSDNTDTFTIYNGSDTSAPVLDQINGVLVLPGDPPLQFTASDANTTGCLTFEFISNGFFEFDGWAANISCREPCQIVTAQIDDITPGTLNGNIYEVPFGNIITFDGSATFSDGVNQNATYEWDFGDGNTATGQSVDHAYAQIGTYFVNLTVTDENGCVSENVIDQEVEVIFDPGEPGPGCPNVNATDELFECVIPDTTTLTASFLETGTTDTYSVESIPYAPAFPFTGLSNPISVNIDDTWSNTINLPFDFCFFGNVESSIKVGSNGVISFQNPTGSGDAFANNWKLENSNPIPAVSTGNDDAMNDANIMLNHDINPTINSSTEIAWEVIGQAPCRTFVVSYSSVAFFSCNDLSSTFQMVLYETTNAIEFYIDNKPNGCSWNDDLAALGIQNNNASLGFSPPNRNLGSWSASQEAWRFVPDGTPNYTFSWYDSAGNFFSSNETITVPVPDDQDDFYTAEVVYDNCNGDQVTVTDDAIIDIEPAFEITDEIDDQEICTGETVTVSVNTSIPDASDLTPSDLTYEWTLDGAVIQGETNPSITIDQGGNYAVEINGGNCDKTESFIVDEFVVPQIQQTPSIEVCHDDLNSFPTVDLTQNDKTELDVTIPSEAELGYYLTQADADAETNEITDAANFTPSAEQQDIFVRAQNTAKTECHTVDSFVVNIYRTEAIAPTEGILNCSTQGLDPDTGTFDLTEKESDIAGPNQNVADVNISYHPSQQDADNDANEITNPTAYQNDTNPQTIYVRVENPDAPDSLNNCALTTSFSIEVDTLPEIQQTVNLNECSVEGQAVTFDLSINNANSMGVADPSNTNVNYYQSQADADLAQNAIGNPSNYTIPGNNASQTIYVRAENANNPDCFSVATFELTIFEVTINPVDDLNECADGSGSETAIFDLTENTALALGTQNPDDYSVSYHTSQADADTGANAISDPTAYQNTTNPQPIWIRINNDNAPINCSSTASFSLSVTESAPVNLDPDPIYACDDNNDGFFNNFDLTQRDDDISLGNPDIAVSYHPTLSDAENNLNPLQSPYANVVENQQTIYIRAEDTTNGCFNTGELELIILDSPLLETPEPLVGCDVNETGILAFDLTQVEDEVLDGIDPTTVNISYHTSQGDAQNNINPIAAPSGYNNNSNPQTVYIRVEDPNSPLNCFNIEPIELQVEPLPDISDPTILEQCDDPTGSGEFDEVATFDLTQKTDEITNSNADLSVTYYATVADQTNDNPIADPTEFVNTENPQTIEVSVSSSETPCISTTTLTVSVDPLPTIPDPEPLEVCDVDNDGFAKFDLAAEETDILDGEIETTLSFHITQAEAEAGTNAIDTSSPFSNTNPDNQTIYVRAEKTTTGCFDVKALELFIIPSPEIDNLQDLSQCDDGDNNGFAAFDLTQNDSVAIGGQDDTDLNISYHLSQNDAQNNINPIAVPSNFINSMNPQTIYVRLENTDTDCFDTFSGAEDTTNSFTIGVEPQPQITEPSPLAVCDDDDNQNPFPQVSFDLTSKESEMLGQPNVPDNLTFNYYESQTDLDNDNPIATPEDFTNTIAPPQTILVEVTDEATENSCKSNTSLTINVLPLPSPSETDPEVLRLTQCDDDRDGVAATPFDLTQSGQLIGESENVDISYYTSENEAEAGEDQGEITTPDAYVNDPSLNIDDQDGNPTNIQIIYARVESGAAGNDCFVIVPFEIIVEPNPVLNPQGDPFGYTLCEDGNSGIAEILSFVDVTNNLFDQSSGDANVIIPLLDQDVSPAQELDDFTISYHNSEAEADNNTNPLSSGYEAGDGETLYIRVESNETGCYNIGNIGEVVISIQPRPAIADAVEDIEVCADEIGDDQVATIDLTEQDGACDPGQADGTTVEVIYYEGMMAFNNGTPIEDPQNYTTVQSPQTIIAEVVDTETLCESADTVSFDIEVNPIPAATIAPFDGSILCIDNSGDIIDNDFSPPVLDSGLATSPSLTFEWSLNGNPLSEDGSSITATEPGTYSLTVTDSASPANCSTTSTAEVIQSQPPQFTAEITTEAFAKIHEILVSNITGIGDYEFRLDNGPWQELPAGQNSLIFQDVSAGSHQVTGRDKNGCGTFIVPVETIGYPDFFTPNQDGYNDTWNINGLSNRDNVKIYIFDRYGKLLKQLNPSGPGWDGTFNGNQMPSNDYWFNVEYQVQTDSTTTKRTLKDNFTLKR